MGMGGENEMYLDYMENGFSIEYILGIICTSLCITAKGAERRADRRDNKRTDAWVRACMCVCVCVYCECVCVCRE